MPTYDTHIQLNPIEAQEARLGTYTYGYSRHIGVRGFQKLINRYAKVLLTLEGSDLSDRNYGTQLPSLFKSNVTSQSDVLEILNTAVSKAEQVVIDYQKTVGVYDADEKLASAALTSVVFESSGASFDAYILLKNQAGMTLQFLLPSVKTTG